MENRNESAPAGIRLVESIGNWVRGIGIQAGFVPIAWDHNLRPGLVWRIPDRGIPGASTFAEVQGVLVRDYERAVLMRNGTILADIGAGVYDIRKLPLKDHVEVIWVSTQVSQLKWGVGRVINPENITLGAHGYVFLQVSDARRFVQRVVAGQQKFTGQDLEDWVFSIVSSVMRTQIALTTIRDLMQGQEEFARACGVRLAATFQEWGIGFRNLVVNQYDVPEEYRRAIAQVTEARFKRETLIIEAEAKADILRIESRAQAEARLTTGAADVELLARMQRLGIDPIRMKAIEALTQYSQLAAESGSGQDSGSDMLKMMLFMQMSKLLTDPGMPSEAKELIRSQYPQQAAQIPQLGAPAASPTPPPDPAIALPAGQPAAAAPNDAAHIQQVLDNLDERLASGEISEATYDRLRAKWEGKLGGTVDSG